MNIIERAVIMENADLVESRPNVQRVPGSTADLAKKMNPNPRAVTEGTNSKVRNAAKMESLRDVEKKGLERGAPVIKDAYKRAYQGNLKGSAAGAAEQKVSPLVVKAKQAVSIGKIPEGD